MSVKSLAAIIGALGVGMSGYAKGRGQFQENERQKTLAKRDDAEYERQQGKIAKADKYETDLAASQADQVVEDVPAYDVSSMGGGDPTKQPVVAYKANGQVFNDRPGAEQALMGINSTAEKERRAAAVARQAGQLDQARKYEEFAKKAIDEGTDQILGGIMSTAPSVEAVKAAGGKVAGTVGAPLADVFNKTGGKWKVSADTMVEHFITKDAAGREIVNSRVVGKDGKPVVEDVRGAALMLADLKTRLEQQNKDTGVYQQGQQIAETSRAHKAGETLAEARAREDAKHNRAQEYIAQQGIGLQQKRLDLESKSFKKQTLAGQIEEIETATGVKLSPEEKKQFAGIGKKGGKAADGNALMDKIVEKSVSTWQENNPTATPGQVATYAASLQQSLGQAKNNVMVENTLKEEFGGLKPDSPAYAAKWQQAKELGLTDQQLVAKGYAAPGKVTNVPNPMARTAAEVGAAPARAPGPRPLSAPVNSGNYERNRNAFDSAPPADTSQQRAAQAQSLKVDIARAQAVLNSNDGAPQFRAQAASRLALYQKQLAALEGQ